MRTVANGNSNAIFSVVSTVALILFGAVHSFSQDLTIEIDAARGSRAQIAGSLSPALASSFRGKASFLDEYAGVAGITRRFAEVRGVDGATEFSALVDLTPIKMQAAAGHVSWIGEEAGVVMLDDLMPQVGVKSARVKISIPHGWRIDTTEKTDASGYFEVADAEKAVFILTKSGRAKPIRFVDADINLIIAGERQFSDKQAEQSAREIFEYYRSRLGPPRQKTMLVGLIPFPSPTSWGSWEADTRGSTAFIVAADEAFSQRSGSRLHEQLRHEIFHFWVPNSLNLSGSYDWFYEGFALYESAKAGVMTNAIGFADFLDVLSRAHAIDARQTGRMSLIDASRKRFNGENTRLYARGMVTAFLCDLAMLEKSKGKRSTSDLLRRVLERHRYPNDRIDGTNAVIAVMSEWPELVPVIERFIRGAETLDWESYLALAGLDMSRASRQGGLRVAAKLSGPQKDLLDRLGYNMWRKSKNRMK